MDIRLKVLVVAFALATLGVCTADAAVITFEGLNLSQGQDYLPQGYQPLMTGYSPVAGDSGLDGGPMGITIDWGGLEGRLASADTAVNPGVFDETPGTNGNGYVGYDGGFTSITITFSTAVQIPDFYFANYFGPGPYSIDFSGALNGNQVVNVPVTYTQNGPGNNGGYQWIEETGLAGYNINSLTITGDLYKQIDDITVIPDPPPPPTRVPEPSSLSLFGAGLLGFVGLTWFRRRKRLGSIS